MFSIGIQLAQNCRYLSEAFSKVDNAFQRKAEAYNNVMATNKSLEEDGSRLKRIAIDANSRADLMEKRWSEADQKVTERDLELNELRLDFSRVSEERDALQVKAARWRRAKKYIYKKGAMDAVLKARNDMIRKFKAGQTDWPTPEPSDDEGDDSESEEISSGDDEPDDAPADSDGQPAPTTTAPEAPRPAPERTGDSPDDSFEEAMEVSRAEAGGPSRHPGEVEPPADPPAGSNIEATCEEPGPAAA